MYATNVEANIEALSPGVGSSALWSVVMKASVIVGLVLFLLLAFIANGCTTKGTAPVNSDVTLTLNADPPTIAAGQTSTLTWSSTNSTSVVSSDFGAETVNGSMVVSPTQTQTFTITVQGAKGEQTARATVTVGGPVQLTLTAAPSTVVAGQSVLLTWSTTHATSVVNSNFGADSLNGSIMVVPMQTMTYSLTVKGPEGQQTAQATVTISGGMLTTVNVESHPETVAVSPITNRCYVTNKGNNTLSVLNGDTNTLLTTVKVGNSPFGVAVNSITNHIYVTNADDDTVSVLDGGTNSLLATVKVGKTRSAWQSIRQQIASTWPIRTKIRSVSSMGVPISSSTRCPWDRSPSKWR